MAIKEVESGSRNLEILECCERYQQTLRSWIINSQKSARIVSVGKGHLPIDVVSDFRISERDGRLVKVDSEGWRIVILGTFNKDMTLWDGWAMSENGDAIYLFPVSPPAQLDVLSFARALYQVQSGLS